jgi:PAS domain S-box-containing protein
VDANDAFLAMVGYDRADLPLRWDTQLTPGEHRAASRRAVEQLRRTGVAAPWEKEYFRKDGSRLSVLVGVAMLPGTTEQCVCFALDVSERNRMRSALVQTDRLASIGMLSAGIAHEINNPLAYVANNLAVLEADLKGLLQLVDFYETTRPALARVDPEAAERAADLVATMDLGYARANLERILARTREGVQRITKIVSSLRSLARTEAAGMEEAHISELVDMSLEVVRGQLKRLNITLEVDHQPSPRLSCVPTQLYQVLLNLLLNAMHAIEAVGRGDAGKIRISTRSLGTELLIEVTDNGSGIAPEDLPRIFDPFFTRKPVGEGTGLGLSISHNIITGHGGRIEVESQLGVGSTFRIYLPLQPPPRSE